jgi:hypothetical protein
MSKFAIGEKVDNAADDHEGGTVIAVFPTVDGNFTRCCDRVNSSQGISGILMLPDSRRCRSFRPQR